MATSISFNGLSLQTTTYRTESIDHVEAPKRNINRQNRARAQGELYVSGWFGARRIRVKGHIVADSASALQTALDALQAALNTDGANLDIGYGGGTRRYKNAVMESQSIEKKGYNHTFVPYDLTFYIPAGVGESTAQTNEGATGRTTDLSQALTIGGSADALPTITVTINSATDLTIVKVKNNTNGDEMIIGPDGAASFSPGDVIVIDCENYSVTINGSEVDYTGIFPRWSPGSQTLVIDLTGTAFNYDWDFDYYPRYL